MSINKRKIFNDPIYGFITIPNELVYDIIEHPYFQRLRRITQLGLTNVVYSGANHTRFQHTLGAMHLMGQAIQIIRSKGHQISEEEETGALIAILLHDIGHGPFSHTLEFTLIEGVHHEHLSKRFMHQLNDEFNGALDLAIQIFEGSYSKPFLHHLVSSQLDVDRLDYLKRDSFFTGVSEGVVGSERIIKMMNVANNELVIEAKGIYSIEKFLIARRLMYWQVYLHKTVLAAEFLLVQILMRAKELAKKEMSLPSSKALHTFLYHTLTKEDFDSSPSYIETFAQLDDYDILTAVKEWCAHHDPVLSRLSKMLINRRLYKIEISQRPFSKERIEALRQDVSKAFSIDENEAAYFVFSDKVQNAAYSQKMSKINLLQKDGSVTDLMHNVDLLTISVLSEPVTKYFICYPKNL